MTQFARALDVIHYVRPTSITFPFGERNTLTLTPWRTCTTSHATMASDRVRDRILACCKGRTDWEACEHELRSEAKLTRAPSSPVPCVPDRESRRRNAERRTDPLRQVSAARAARSRRDGRGLQGQGLRRRGLREDPRHQAHPAGARENPSFVDDVHRRGQARGPLSHANIVQVFDLGARRRRRYFIAMEYVAGIDLRGVLERAAQGQAPIAAGAGGATSSARSRKGLDYAHRRRDERGAPLDIVHRDVSPQNVLLCSRAR